MTKLRGNKHITKKGVVKNNPKRLDAEDKYFRDYFNEIFFYIH